MKSCAAGGWRKGQRAILKFLPWLTLAAWGFVSDAHAVAYRSWFLEQLAAPPIVTEKGQTRSQVGTGVENFVDTISAQISGQIDLKQLELRALYSQRFFPLLTDQGRTEQSALSSEVRALGLEVARYFITINRQYGRLAFGVYDFFPGPFKYARIGVDTGVAGLKDTDWSAAFAASVFLSFPKGGDALLLRLEAMRRFSLGASSVKLGGFLCWTDSLTNISGFPPGDYESMLFTLGPSVLFETVAGTFRVNGDLRLFLNGRIDSTGTVVANPSEFPLPGVSLEWGRTL